MGPILIIPKQKLQKTLIGTVSISLSDTVPKLETPFGLELIIDGGGSEIAVNTIIYRRIPFSCEIISASLMADQCGEIVVDIWKDIWANYPPINDDSITASAPLTIEAVKVGTATATTADHLIDTTADQFAVTDIGKLVHNTTDNTYALITAYNSDTDLTLDTDIMESAESYEILPANSEDINLVGWNKSIVANDVLAYNVDSCSRITRITIVLVVRKL